MTYAQQAYRSAKVEGVTQLQAHLLVLDQISLHLAQAIKSVRTQDIAGRCEASNEILNLFGHLESWAASFEDPVLAQSLQTLYAFCRARLLSAQTSVDAGPFVELAELVAGTRDAWHTKQERLLLSANTLTTAVGSTPWQGTEAGVTTHGWRG